MPENRPNPAWRVAIAISLALAVVADLWLVLVRRSRSISMSIWLACQRHPTLIAAGVMATIAGCYLTRDEWGFVAFLGFIGGHCFSGIPVDDPAASS